MIHTTKKGESPIIRKFHILLAALILLLGLSACSNESNQQKPSDTAEIADSTQQNGQTVESETASSEQSNIYFAFLLEDGTEKTVLLPDIDPACQAELHLAPLDDTGVSNRIVLYSRASGTDINPETAYVYDGETGEELPLTPPGDVLAQYLSVNNTENAWVLHIGGSDYSIDKTQFSDYADEELFDTPDFSQYNDFYVENGLLYCRIRILCTNALAGYAKESLLIRYGFEAGAIIPVEITFCKSENTSSVPTAESESQPS